MMSSRTSILAWLLAASLSFNLWFVFSPREQLLVNPRPGKDCSVEMKSLLDGTWSSVIFVHGYVDNHSVAKHIVELAEKDEESKGGRPKGSFRVKSH
jgi:hypothetical protein